MSSSTLPHHWSRNLESFIKGRLHQRSRVGSPICLTNSQYIIDGIVMAINDHPTWYKESFHAVINVIKRRFKELYESNYNYNNNACKYGTTPFQQLSEVAAMDLYLSWCVFDGICKGCVVAELIELAGNELPILLINFMPIFKDFSLINNINNNCTLLKIESLLEINMDYTPLYWNIVRSWYACKTFSAEVLSKCSSRIREKFDEKISGFNKLSIFSSETPSQHEARKDLPLLFNEQRGIEDDLIPQFINDENNLMHNDKQNGSEDRKSFQYKGVSAVNTFISQLFSNIGTNSSNYCVYCGAPFPTKEARDEHAQLHTDQRGLVGLVRLLHPKPNSFLSYSADHSNGFFIRVTSPINEIIKSSKMQIMMKENKN